MNALGLRVRRLFSTQYMVKENERLGELPPSREAYLTFSSLAWPAMIESMFVVMAGFIDTIMVSGASDTAIAAVGITTQPRMLFYVLFFAMSSATVALVSRRFGEKDREGANRCIAQTFSISIWLAVFSLVTAFLTAEPLLRFAGAKTDTMPEALVYFKITIVGLMIHSLGIVLNSGQRGVGKTRITMRSSMTGNLINIVFNYFLINGIWIFPEMGVKGAAIATLIGHICSFLVSLSSFFIKDSYLKLRLKYFLQYEKSTLQALFRVGSGAGVEQLFVRVGMFMFAKVVAELGTDAMTTHQICMNIINLSFSCGDGLGVAATAMVGQNLGRGRPDVSLLYGKVAQRIAWAFSSVLFVFFCTCGRFLIALFTDDAQIIASGTTVMYVVAFVSLAQVSQVIFTGSLRGAGDTKFNAVVSLISMVVLRPLIAYFLCHVVRVGLLGAWFALTFDQYLRCICVTVHFYRGKWKTIKL